MRYSTTTKTTQWIVFGIVCAFSSFLLVLGTSSKVSLNELKYAIHKRAFNEPARLQNFSGGIKRSLSTNNRKRDGDDDTKTNNTSTSTSASDSDSDPDDDDYTLLPAYFTPNSTEAHALLSKKLSVRKWMATHRSDFIACCSESLSGGSEQFQKNETFGWFHFQQDFDKSKIIDEVIVTVDVACYEVSEYDPTGEHPGTPIQDFTQEVVDKLKWTKKKAKEDAQALREEFANQSSNSTSTAKKNGSDSGVQKSKGDNSKTEGNTSTEKKKPTETTPQTTNDGNETSSETSNDSSSNDNASTSQSSTANDSSEGASDSQKSTDETSSG